MEHDWVVPAILIVGGVISVLSFVFLMQHAVTTAYRETLEGNTKRLDDQRARMDRIEDKIDALSDGYADLVLRLDRKRRSR